MDFHLGSALAGVYQAGNEAEDLHFYGGRYGILTEKTSPTGSDSVNSAWAQSTSHPGFDSYYQSLKPDTK